MISDNEWQQIRQVVADAQRAAMHCSIATVNSKGFPSIIPIGTVFLNKKTSTGFFFDTYLLFLRICSISRWPAYRL